MSITKNRTKNTLTKPELANENIVSKSKLFSHYTLNLTGNSTFKKSVFSNIKDFTLISPKVGKSFEDTYLTDSWAIHSKIIVFGLSFTKGPIKIRKDKHTQLTRANRYKFT